MLESLPPGLILVLGALVVPFLRGRVLKAWVLVLPLVGLWQVHQLPDGVSSKMLLFGEYDLEIVRVDGLSRPFGYIFHVAAFLCALFSLHVKDRLQHVVGLMYAGAAVGGVFAGDLVTLFVYWEVTAFTSVFLIWARRTERSYATGLRYLVIQVASGVLLLAGTIIHVSDGGSVAFDGMELGTLGTTLIFVAFGIKAAFPLLHSWLWDAYPEGTATGTVYLATFTTKLAIYALARGFAGTDILIPIGLVMAVYPVVYAVFQNDLRRVMVCALHNQLGYMVVGIGIGTELALNGTVAHAFAGILYKGLLFMSLGAVLYRAGTVKASELGGLYRSMPVTTALCLVGAASIASMPLLGGFVSKSMIVSAAAEEHHTVAFLVLLFAGAAVLYHSALRIPFAAFFGKDSGKRPQEAPPHMLAAMGIAAALCVALGVFYEPFYDLLPYESDYTPYTTTHVVTQLQLLLFAVLGFFVLRRLGLYPRDARSTLLDVDWSYRRALPATVSFLRRAGGGAWEGALAAAAGVLRALGRRVRRLHLPPGTFGEPWPIGETTLWTAILIALYLVYLYV